MSETNKATFVIGAPKNYDVKKYSLGVYNNFNTRASIVSYGLSELEFEFNQTDEDGNFVAIVEYKSKEPLKNPRITLFNGTINESKSYKSRNAFQDNKRLPFAYPDNNESDNDNNKSQIFKIELCESHEATLQKMHDNELCYEYWTEDQLNKCKGNLSKIEQTELNIEEEEEEAEENIQNTQNDQSSKATENNQIPLKIDCKIKNVNAFLLNGEFHFLDDENDKIYLDKNKEYKIEPVYYDNEKQKFYYFPKSNVYKFNTFHINDSSIKLNIEDKFELCFYNDNNDDISNDINLDKNSINHEKSSNLELGFGIPLALAAIGFAFALAFGGLPAIIALPFIIGLGILGGGLICKGGYDKSQIYTPPKENKSQEPETENSDESNPSLSQGSDDPIWTSVKSQSQDSNENQPLFETNNDDIFQNNGEEEDWGEPT